MEQNLTSTLMQLRDKAYQDAKEKGFHDKEYSDEHWLMLIVCEIAEAVEADRHNSHADVERFEKYRTTMGYENAFERYIKDTVEDELADVCIRILDFMGLNVYEIDKAAGDIVNYEVENYECKETFSEVMFLLVSKLTGQDIPDSLDRSEIVLLSILIYCEHSNIDILRHIQLKMEYNRTRPRLHGKRY